MLGSLEDSALFLETCILNLEILSMMQLFQKTEIKCKILTLECLLRMQLCALLSQLHRHQEALYHGQIAVRISHFLLRDLKAFIKSLVFRENFAKMDKNFNAKDLPAKDLKSTSSRIELKSNRSAESAKKTPHVPKSERESKPDNDARQHDKLGNDNESMESIENEIETMSILTKGYK